METQIKPVISIIIPAYNEAKFIEACLSSIFHQKVSQSFEVIVVDNNSFDNTCAIASKWKEVKLISEKKPGVSAARNSGAKIAQSGIYYFLDADCRIPSGRLEDIIQEFNIDPSLGLISGPYIYDQDGFFPRFITGTLGYFSLYHIFFKLITGINQFSGGNIIIKKELFTMVGRFNESIESILVPEDLDLAMRLQTQTKLHFMYGRKYAVFSSFRRVKLSPIKDTVARFFAMLSQLNRRIKRD